MSAAFQRILHSTRQRLRIQGERNRAWALVFDQAPLLEIREVAFRLAEEMPDRQEEIITAYVEYHSALMSNRQLSLVLPEP